MIRKAVLLSSLAVLCACASHRAAHKIGPNASAQAQMERGYKALETEDYSEAAAIFDHLLVQKPASQFDLITLFNDGAAYQGLGDCKRSTELYRQAAQGAHAMRMPQMEAEAFYSLSLAYECMGDDKKTIAALMDARRRAKFLPPDVAQAELPARLAVAYARVGQRSRALRYFREAGDGLKQALATSGGTTNKVQQEFAARTLYEMGKLTARQRALDEDPGSYLKSLSIQQPYLLQSAELASMPDSRKAADDLIFAYENLMKLKPQDSPKARSFLELALQDIAEIKRIRLPGKGALVDEIYDKIDVQESRIRQQLMAQADITPLTSEAKRREGLRRQGRSTGSSPLEKPNRIAP